jgi:dCMP deaminase
MNTNNIPDWNTYFMNMLDLVAARSLDKHTKVGCIIVGINNEIKSTGYNSLPRGVLHLDERLERPEKYKWIEHADRNAIYNAARIGVSLENCKMYLSFYPCIECARAIIQVGIKEVIINYDIVSKRMEENVSKYNEENKTVEIMFSETGVILTKYSNC